MKKIKSIATAVLLCILFSTQVRSQETTIFPKGEISTTDNHTGTIWLKELNTTDSIFNLSLAQATFAPGAKLDWHTHPAGQYLLITEGKGYYQEQGKPVQVVHKGDVIKCLPGVEHWHGAVPGSSFTYIGITPTQKGKTIWSKRVTDAEYKSVVNKEKTSSPGNGTQEQEIINLSKQKWNWMADKNVDSLNVLFDAQAMFVHMGGTWGKDRELEIIKSGFIWYKKAEVYSTSVRFFGNTAIVLNEIDLVAVVGTNEVTNPFMVTEVYTNENGKWNMDQLTFSHLSRQVKLK